MTERIMLYLGIVTVFWLLLWLYRKENKPGIENDPTPFAMRSSSYAEQEATQDRKIVPKAAVKP